jgi:LuxR family maltose regulon positive regulatory protein
MRGRRAEQMRLAEEAMALTRDVGLIDAAADGEVHTAYGAALAAAGRREEAIPHLEKGVFLRRLWAQPLDLVDGLIALASQTRSAALFAEAEEILKRCRDAGALPARLAAAKRAARVAQPALGASLSERERTVLELLRSGLSEREVAAELVVSFNTVHSHVKAIYRKLGVSSRAEALEHPLGEIAPR